MKYGKINEGFSFIPTINLGWITWKGKRIYFLQFMWLFWYITTLRKFPWEN